VNKTPIRKEEKGVKERLIFFSREPETEKNATTQRRVQ